MLVCPECERHGSELIDFRNGEAVSPEIDGLQISVARVTRFHPNVLELRRRVHAQPFLARLFAGRAGETNVIPFGAAQRADQRTLRALTFRAQHARQWLRAAERTDRQSNCRWSQACTSGEVLHSGLQESLGKTLPRTSLSPLERARPCQKSGTIKLKAEPLTARRRRACPTCLKSSCRPPGSLSSSS